MWPSPVAGRAPFAHAPIPAQAVHALAFLIGGTTFIAGAGRVGGRGCEGGIRSRLAARPHARHAAPTPSPQQAPTPPAPRPHIRCSRPGTAILYYPDYKDSAFISALLYTIGSIGFWVVDVQEFLTFKGAVLRTNIFMSFTGSFLYIVGSVGFFPTAAAYNPRIGAAVWRVV